MKRPAGSPSAAAAEATCWPASQAIGFGAATPAQILAADENARSLGLTGTLTIEAAADGGEGKTGKPRFNLQAYSGGPMRVAGWMYPVVVDGQGVSLAGERLPIYVTHDLTTDNLVGQTDSVDVNAKGQIAAKGPFTAKRETSQAYAQMLDHDSNGFQWQCSIGASVLKYEFCDAGKSVVVNGRSVPGPVNVARKVALNHIAIVPLGADTTTVATIAAQGGQENQTMTFEQWIVAQGKDMAALSDADKAKLQAAYDAAKAAGVLPPVHAGNAGNGGGQTQPPSQTPPPVQASVADELKARNEAHAKNLRRVAALDQLQARYASVREVVLADGTTQPAAEFIASAIERGAEPDAVELVLLRASRAPSQAGLPAIHAGKDGRTPNAVVEAALVLANNVITDDKALVAAYGEQTLDAAGKLRRVRMSKLIELVCSQHGVSLPLAVDDQYIHAAFSNQALTGILGNVANKALGASFMAVNQVAPKISRAKSHMNFHAHTVYSMALNGDLEQVGPRGELKNMNLSEESYTRQVKTRGAVLSISRADLINDELGAFLETAGKFGRKAALARERATFLLLNATGAGVSFFTAARANYIEGAATALSYASLGTAVQAMRDQTGPDGDPIGVEPKILMVPTALEVTGKELTDPASQLIATALGSTSAAKREPQTNIWRGSFRCEISEWLSKTIGTQAGSSTAWYLFADPADVAAVEISYLNGLQAPTINFFGLDTDPNVLGVSWQCFWDFGVDLAEYRAAVKSKGAA